jgi:DNA-binding transcriptional ArsR family regulator
MSVELPRPDPVPLVPVVEFANPVRLLAAIADPVRYWALKELAAGAYLSPTELAKTLGVKVDCMSKHMRVLRDRGAVQLVSPEGGDGRVQYYQIPQRFRATTDAGRPLLDYGVCVVRF